MLTFILVGGLVWLAVAMFFVLALAAAARPREADGPATVVNLVETPQRERESIHAIAADVEPALRPVQSPVPA